MVAAIAITSPAPPLTSRSRRLATTATTTARAATRRTSAIPRSPSTRPPTPRRCRPAAARSPIPTWSPMPVTCPSSNVVVTDDKCAPVTGPAAGGDANSNGKLDLTESWTYTCTTTITATTTNVGTANADWTDCSKAKGGGSDGSDGSDHNGDSARLRPQWRLLDPDDRPDPREAMAATTTTTCVTKTVPPASDSATVTVATPGHGRQARDRHPQDRRPRDAAGWRRLGHLYLRGHQCR